MHSSRKKTVVAFLSVATVVVLSGIMFMWRAELYPRSVPGHMLRWLKGEKGAQQEINDMAQDIRNIPSLAVLPSWGRETLKRFQEGKVQTDGAPQFYWDQPPAVKLASREKPEFIKRQWGETNELGEEEPEIFVVFSTNKQPDAVVIGWYMFGIQIGPPTYKMPYHSWENAPYVEAKPGVYVYANYK